MKTQTFTTHAHLGFSSGVRRGDIVWLVGKGEMIITSLPTATSTLIELRNPYWYERAWWAIVVWWKPGPGRRFVCRWLALIFATLAGMTLGAGRPFGWPWSLILLALTVMAVVASSIE